jgi:hypothetical protein
MKYQWQMWILNINAKNTSIIPSGSTANCLTAFDPIYGSVLGILMRVYIIITFDFASLAKMWYRK